MEPGKQKQRQDPVAPAVPNAPRNEPAPAAEPARPTLHLIGNGHIDIAWLWRTQEGFQEVMATFRSVLDRMHAHPEVTFPTGSAAMFEFVERHDPKMFAELKKRVAEGRLDIVGGWWVEPDMNLPGGESMVRQGLYGQRYFQEKVGVMARVGFQPDGFGHSAMLPQILRKQGMPYYVFMRPGSHERGLPGGVFWWESDDGSRVLASRIPHEYTVWANKLEAQLIRSAAEVKAPLQ